MEKILEGKPQAGVIVFGGAISSEKHIQEHCTAAKGNGFHVVIENDHAKLFRCKEEAPIMVDHRHLDTFVRQRKDALKPLFVE